jgi:hypothetical protein
MPSQQFVAESLRKAVTEHTTFEMIGLVLEAPRQHARAGDFDAIAELVLPGSTQGCLSRLGVRLFQPERPAP